MRQEKYFLHSRNYHAYTNKELNVIHLGYFLLFTHLIRLRKRKFLNIANKNDLYRLLHITKIINIPLYELGERVEEKKNVILNYKIF